MAPKILRTQPCYISTQKHIRSFIGRFLWIYTGKAELQLEEQELRLNRCDGFALRIPLNAIVGIDTGRYSLWAKPLGLDYIAVTFMDSDLQRTVLVTPTESWTTPTWKTNRIVADWLQLLRESIATSPLPSRPNCSP